MAARNPLFHESVVYSLPATVVASAISSALVMWLTGSPTDKVMSVFVPTGAIFLLLWLWNAAVPVAIQNSRRFARTVFGQDQITRDGGAGAVVEPEFLQHIIPTILL